jgi:hypothetical protein
VSPREGNGRVGFPPSRYSIASWCSRHTPPSTLDIGEPDELAFAASDFAVLECIYPA